MIVENIVVDVQARIRGIKGDKEDRSLYQHVAANWELELQDIPRLPQTCSLTQHRAGYGRQIRDNLGTPVDAFAGVVERNRVLWLETYALYSGLLIAIDRGCLNIWISMDSKVAVDILNKRAHCPWRVLCLVYKIWELRANFENFEVHHVWREVNQPVDFLASWAVSQSEHLMYPIDFPLALKDVILRDATQCIYSRM